MTIYLTTLAAILLETVFFTYPFTLLIIIMAALTRGAGSLFIAFAAGLILDIFGLRLLGSDSLIFVFLTAFLLRYNRRINFSNFFNVIIFIMVTLTLYSFIFYREYLKLPFFILTVPLSVFLLLFLPFIENPKKQSNKLKI